MKILALDLSSNITGFAVLDEKFSLLDFGEIPLKKYKKKSNPMQYLQVLYESVQDLYSQHMPDIIYIEEIFARNIQTIKSLARMRGIAEIALVNCDAKNLKFLNATSVRKIAFGNGSLKKEECFELLKTTYNLFNETFYTPGYDMSDAICLGIAGIKKEMSFK